MLRYLFSADSDSGYTTADIEQIRIACSHCHLFPDPKIASDVGWKRVLPAMVEQSRDLRLRLPENSAIRQYFFDLARSQQIYKTEDEGGSRFVLKEDADSLRYTGAVKIACINSISEIVLLCDLGRQAIVAIDLSGFAPQLTSISVVTAPVHITITDLDQDGSYDMVISDIGQLQPADTDTGRILWLRTLKDQTLELVPLVTGLSRVVETYVRDMDNDGDLDLVVAEFGHARTGGLYVYWNDSTSNSSAPNFERQTLDSRSGIASLVIVDIDNNGFLDVIASVSQEHEEIIAHTNFGSKQFRHQTVFKAPHPAWGLAGIAVADIDADGNLDILSTSGDHLDSLELKEFHGLYWSKLQIDGAYETQRLATLPGALRIKVSDLDNDGDLDLIVTALLSPMALPRDMSGEVMLDTLIWLENHGGGEFQRHVVSKGAQGFSAVLTLDIDQDGDIDLITSRLDYVEYTSREGERENQIIQIYLNSSI